MGFPRTGAHFVSLGGNRMRGGRRGAMSDTRSGSDTATGVSLLAARYAALVALDPPSPVTDLDWSPERATAFGTRVLDLYASFLAELPDAPTSPQLTTAGVRAAVALDVPDEPLGEDALVAHLRAIVDNSVRVGGGGFLAVISGGGTVPGAIADLLASGLNANTGGWFLSPAATEIEGQLIRWLTDRFGLPPGAGGHLVSGGSLANLRR